MRESSSTVERPDLEHVHQPLQPRLPALPGLRLHRQAGDDERHQLRRVPAGEMLPVQPLQLGRVEHRALLLDPVQGERRH